MFLCCVPCMRNISVGGREGGPSDGAVGPLHERGGWWSRPSSRAAQVIVLKVWDGMELDGMG